MKIEFKRLFFMVSALLFLSVNSIHAQLIHIEKRKDIVNKLAIKSTISAPFEIYNSFNIGVEGLLSPNIGIQSGFNVVRSLFTNHLDGLSRHNVRGYRFRNELRFYSFEIIPDKNMYAAFEVSFDNISFGKYRTLEILDPLTQREYYQYKLVNEHRRGQTVNMKIGYVYRFSESIYIDIFCGLGIQNVKRITYDIPDNVVRVYDEKRIDQLESSRVFPNAVIGWAIGYRIK